jgi:hypothetical protein
MIASTAVAVTILLGVISATIFIVLAWEAWADRTYPVVWFAATGAIGALAVTGWGFYLWS